MAMVYCRGCGKEIHESAQTCPSCGAPQHVSGGTKAMAVTSWDQVPWYRKNWGAILLYFVFAPAFIVIALTGEIYFRKNGELNTMKSWAKIVLTVLWLLAFVFKVLKA